MRRSIRVLLLALGMAATGGCAVDAPPIDVGETEAAGTTYECLDICPPPAGSPCHHVCVLNHDPPEIGGSVQPSVCSGIHELRCGDGCCDSQEAYQLVGGRFRSTCPQDCTLHEIHVQLQDDGRVSVNDEKGSLATLVGEFFVPAPVCR